jgi:hypothetical protein
MPIMITVALVGVAVLIEGARAWRRTRERWDPVATTSSPRPPAAVEAFEAERAVEHAGAAASATVRRLEGR